MKPRSGLQQGTSAGRRKPVLLAPRKAIKNWMIDSDRLAAAGRRSGCGSHRMVSRRRTIDVKSIAMLSGAKFPPGSAGIIDQTTCAIYAADAAKTTASCLGRTWPDIGGRSGQSPGIDRSSSRLGLAPRSTLVEAPCAARMRAACRAEPERRTRFIMSRVCVARIKGHFWPP